MELLRIFDQMFVFDLFEMAVTLAMFVGLFLIVCLSKNSKILFGTNLIHAVGLFLGGVMLACANNMTGIFLGIESLSLFSLMLVNSKKNKTTNEILIKQLMITGISSILMICGMVYIYNVTGMIQIKNIISALNSGMINSIYIILFVVGVICKLALVPFHMWIPNVYEKSHPMINALLAVLFIMAGTACLLRFNIYFTAFNYINIEWNEILLFLGMISVTYGNISALFQKSIKRMLGFLVMVHSGHLLLIISVVNEFTTEFTLFYLIHFCLMIVIVFGIVNLVYEKHGNDHLERFTGMFYTNPLSAVLMSIAMISLAGFPPFCGFIGKFIVVSVLFSNKCYVLTLLAILNSIISIYYYLNVVGVMIFRNKNDLDSNWKMDINFRIIMILLVIMAIWMTIFGEYIFVFFSHVKILN